MSLWRHRDFLKLWSAQTISLAGTQLTQLALPLTAVLWLAAPPFAVGLLAAAQYLPFILFGLVAGGWVDRVRRRPVLLVSDLVRAAVLAVVPIAWFAGGLRLWMLFPVAFVVGVCNVSFDVAHQSYLPSLVGREQLLEGNTNLQLSFSGAVVVGPGLGGVLVQALTAPVTLLLDVLSFLASAALLLSIGAREPAAPAGGRGGLLREVGDGLRFVFGHPHLRPIALATALDNLFGLSGMLAPVLVVYALRDLRMAPATYGLVLALGNAGALVGALANRRVSERLGIGPAIVASAAVPALAIFLLPPATPATAPLVLVVSLAASWFAIAVYNVNQVSLRQAVTPEHLLGRMNATMRFVIWGTIPVGTTLGGFLATVAGTRPTLWMAAAGSVVGVLPLLLSGLRSLRRIPSASTAVEAT